jgi:hypothetical protein
MAAVPTLPMLLTSWPPSRAPRLVVPEARQPAGPEAVLGAGTPLTLGRAGGAQANAVARRLRRHHSSPLPTGSAAPDARLTIGRAATLTARIMIMSTRRMPGGLPRPVDLN